MILLSLTSSWQYTKHSQMSLVCQRAKDKMMHRWTECSNEKHCLLWTSKQRDCCAANLKTSQQPCINLLSCTMTEPIGLSGAIWSTHISKESIVWSAINNKHVENGVWGMTLSWCKLTSHLRCDLAQVLYCCLHDIQWWTCMYGKGTMKGTNVR